MNLSEAPSFSAVYIPDAQRIVFFEGDRMSHGFEGSLAVSKYLEALRNNIEVIITESTMQDNTALIRRFHAILAKKGLMNLKEDILASHGVESSKELTSVQLEQIIERLDTTHISEDVRKGRSAVLALLSKIGIHGSNEIGWETVNHYLSDPRIAGKPLYELSACELQATVSKLRAIQHKNKHLTSKTNDN